MERLAKKIVDARSSFDFVPVSEYPQPSEYVVTQMQAGNIQGEKGWVKYIGYVVQVRLKAGAFGSDIVFLRHPDGALMTHENQSFYRLSGTWLEKVKSLYPTGLTPHENESYTEAYTIGGEFPEIGGVIENPKPGYQPDESPLMRITISSADSESVIVV